uniref:Uncharacterized protein n=1 Tax=Tanacetum cinerariifolium TaxID=118510 RepID=A0A6L2P337_TANCI|nr:hypothetical protein [Tanacetum cinerariifolium]
MAIENEVNQIHVERSSLFDAVLIIRSKNRTWVAIDGVVWILQLKNCMRQLDVNVGFKLFGKLNIDSF